MQGNNYGILLLRITLGALFLFTGITKALDPNGPIGMLTNLGFPVPVLFGWVLLLAEIICGLAILIGLKARYFVWPLIIILLVAIFTVVIPGGNMLSVIFHFVGIAALIDIFLRGSGPLSVDNC